MDFRFWITLLSFGVFLIASDVVAAPQANPAKEVVPKFYCYQTKGSVNQRFAAGYATCKDSAGKDEVQPREEVCLESAFCAPATDSFKTDIQYENIRVNKGAAKPFDQLDAGEIAAFMNVATDRSHGRLSASSSLLTCRATRGVCPPATLCQAEELYYNFQDNQAAIYTLPTTFPKESTTTK